ncbi:hypothetical protein VTH8203_01345 [Vibrio thalassae]|uniref:Uncharacterized protein n=1 Tax=Vibrio thalassae TaxID=1243014 RepID=A0A240EIG4_9VIBR|nr:AcaB family transcriptional regulator [Vibrio thalassae]SNX47730.1 hypothetical protein VTH8203_01345 [Vibrio thalassae]
MTNRKVQEASKTPFEHQSSMSITGEMIENKPAQTVCIVQFYTKVAPKLLFSVKDNNAAKQGRFIIGVDWFDTKLAPLYTAIRNDDPFADQLLVDIEISIDELGDAYKAKQEEIRELIANRLTSTGTRIEFPADGYNNECRVSFNNRLAYSFLWLTKELDNYMYYLYLADKYNVIERAQYNELWREAKRSFRYTLGKINGWKATSITRVDLAQGTARVPVAFNLNEKISLSQEVLLLEERAGTAPPISSWKNNILPNDVLNRLKETYC